MVAGVVLTVSASASATPATNQDEAHDAFVVVASSSSRSASAMVASLMGFVLSSRLGLFPQRPSAAASSDHA